MGWNRLHVVLAALLTACGSVANPASYAGGPDSGVVDAGVDAPVWEPTGDGGTIGVVSQLAVGSEHACALETNGRVACWGNNTYGQSNPPPGVYKYVASGERIVRAMGPGAAKVYGTPHYAKCGEGIAGRAEFWTLK